MLGISNSSYLAADKSLVHLGTEHHPPLRQFLALRTDSLKSRMEVGAGTVHFCEGGRDILDWSDHQYNINREKRASGNVQTFFLVAYDVVVLEKSKVVQSAPETRASVTVRSTSGVHYGLPSTRVGHELVFPVKSQEHGSLGVLEH